MKGKKILSIIVIAVLTFATVFMTGCGGTNKFDTPADFTFDSETGKFSFKTVTGAEKYQVAIQKILNDSTGASLKEINGSSLIEHKDKDGNVTDSFYVWAELVGASSGLQDNKGTGTISGEIIFRVYSSSASTVGNIIEIKDIPKGEYYVTCVAETAGGKAQSDPAWKKITIGGTLENPLVTCAKNAATGEMTFTLGGSSGSAASAAIPASPQYLIGALAYRGLPSKIEVKVSDGTNTQTIVYDDWSYKNVVQGPTKSFNFNYAAKPISYDSSKTYTATAQAFGDGATVKDSEVVNITVPA